MNIETGAPRTPHDLSHLIFTSGKIGRLKVLDFIPCIAGDSVDINMVGSMRLSPLRRGLAVDSKVDICSFFVPYRFIYGEAWNDFMQEGIDSRLLPSSGYQGSLPFLGMSGSTLGGGMVGSVPKWLYESYRLIYNNYYKRPWDNDFSKELTSLSEGEKDDGLVCAHLKTLWSAPLPPDTRTVEKFDTEDGGASIDIMGLTAQYAKLFTEQERDAFMTRYRDVIESFGGSTPYDADKRPHFLMRSEFWASGYDVDGTDQTSLGQFSGRVQQAFTHKVPRFFVPEHGVIMTVALVRFPPICENENHFLAMNGAHTYLDLAGDPALVGNLPPRVVTTPEIFSGGSGTVPFKVAESQWYRYHPNVVDSRYGDLQGFPFINMVGMKSLDDLTLIKPDMYDSMFQTTQLGHWNAQIRANVTAMRNLPFARDAILTS
ncbi:MAG: major capsid protein [Microviridae sp.]|nr:MAG: major capsid protein [Microviridae sp.]